MHSLKNVPEHLEFQTQVPESLDEMKQGYHKSRK